MNESELFFANEAKKRSVSLVDWFPARFSLLSSSIESEIDTLHSPKSNE